jgi:hypothetical protein
MRGTLRSKTKGMSLGTWPPRVQFTRGKVKTVHYKACLTEVAKVLNPDGRIFHQFWSMRPISGYLTFDWLPWCAESSHLLEAP